ncbi:MAG: hypothetical protein HFJ20_03240 [Clostridia bacterium]|nr:hypothetical protein [Clostridia bacterium]
MSDKLDLENYVLLTKKEYGELMECKTKAKQYKEYILDNTNNNKLTELMVTIEGKSYRKLIAEKNKEEF